MRRVGRGRVSSLLYLGIVDGPAEALGQPLSGRDHLATGANLALAGFAILVWINVCLATWRIRLGRRKAMHPSD